MSRKQLPEAQQMPQALDLERAVIGAMILESVSIDKAIGIVNDPMAFYQEEHRVIFTALKQMYHEGRQIDFMTLSEYLRKSGDLEKIGGAYFVTSLTRDVVSSAHIETHCMVIMEMYMRRELINRSHEAIRRAYSLEFDIFDTITYANKNTAHIEALNSNIELSSIGELMDECIDEMNKNRQKSSNLIGYSTGLSELDEALGGIIPSDYIVLAAGTGEGKSTLAVNVAVNIAMQGIPTAIYSLEMKGSQLAFKIMSDKTEYSIKKLRMGAIDEQGEKKVLECKLEHKEIPLYVYDKTIMIDDLIASIRYLVRTKGVKFVLVDYLQLVKPTREMNKGNREQVVSQISKELRAISLDLNIPIIALSQLAEMEKGVSRLYRLGDLRESKSIGHDATTVLMIWKPILNSQQRYCEKFNINGIDYAADDKDALLLVLKNRLDSTAIIRLKTEFEYSRFRQYSSMQISEPEPIKFAHRELNQGNYDLTF
jgi:replicative DNA helicase